MWDVTIDVTHRRRVLARLPAPALGYAWAAETEAGGDTMTPIANPVEGDERFLGNGLVEVVVAADGTFRLAGGGTVLDGVGRIVDGGDAGDSYNYGPPAGDRLVDRPESVDIRLGQRGPLRGDLTIVRTYAWPRGLTADAMSRTTNTVLTEVTTTLELRADERFVRVSLAFDNDSTDHRVRFHVPLPAPVGGSSAEGQFAVVDRGLELEAGHGEYPLPTFPAVSFVSVEGCSALLDQVTEYEVVDGRELALTVLRSFGLISRNANPYREDPAGPEVPVPAAQLLGARSFRFALFPHAGTWLAARVADAAERYRHPFVVVRSTGPADAPTAPVPGLRLTGDRAVLSAVRRRADWLEIRVVNQGPTPCRATLGMALTEAREADLLGRAGASMTVSAGAPLTLDLGPWEIRTVHVR
jgi:alpha-mannosidase